MADDIVRDIRKSRKAFSNDSSDELTLDQARAKYRKEILEKEREIARKNVQEQVKLENSLRAKGLKESSAEYQKAMKKAQEALDKERQAADIKRITEAYEYQRKLDEELAQARHNLNIEIMKSEEASRQEKMKAWGENFAADFSTNTKGLFSKAAQNFVDGLTGGLNEFMTSYAQYQAKINARIQGAGKNFSSMENLMTTAVGVQPYIKNQSMVENLAVLVDKGIAYNVELRSFIQTVKDNIATTFDATNGTLMRLIRIQQSDSTAARLGLEANLTRYFNAMYQSTEYLSDSFDAVSDALIEASSTMSNDRAIQFEYQVQKWLGSLYSVGVSSQAVSGIAQALGQLGSGNVSALSGSNFQNLLVMAAARAGLSYGELLTGGLDADTTNALLQSIVEYLKEIAGDTNHVVKSELGRVFGMSVSDLQSALNLSTETISSISGRGMNYGSSIAELLLQMTMLPGRMSIATMMDNMWSNLEWGLASNIASSPALYSIWKVTDMIQKYTGGINVPSVFAMGNGFNLNTTIENLVKLGVVGVSSLGMIGDLISGLSSTAVPSTMLLKMGLAQGVGNIVSTGGRGLATAVGGLTSSSTVVAGNSSGEDVYTSAKQGAKDAAEAEAADAQEEETNLERLTRETNSDVHEIYLLLSSAIDAFGVKTHNGLGA